MNELRFFENHRFIPLNRGSIRNNSRYAWECGLDERVISDIGKNPKDGEIWAFCPICGSKLEEKER